MGKVVRILALGLMLGAASCVPEDFNGIQFSIPINSGPEPQRQQPAQPSPPLPTDALHPFSE